MEEFPPRVVVGEGPYQTVYALQANQLLVRFHEDTADARIDALLKTRDLKEHRFEEGVRRLESLRAAKMRWVHVGQTGKLRDLAGDLASSIQEIISVTPIYFVDGSGDDTAASPMPDNLVVRLKDPRDRRTLRELGRMGLELNEQMSSLLGPFHYFEVKASVEEEGEEPSAFDLVGRVSEMPAVDNVEFDWLKLETYQLIPSDTLWPNQWDMGQINLVDAWDVETGSDAVWIAIIDSGFDLAHPDITYTPNSGGTLTHFNADQAIAGNPPPYNAGPSGVPHGTAVTGLAAAITNNAQGVSGVAGGCSVMPVRLGTVPTADRVAAGINWAAANGARVANLSLTTTATAAAIAAVANAWTAGMVLCAATGNGGGNTTSPAIGFPANHANTIGVGASDQNDQRKRPASADGECWGSQFGPQVDVVAPGVLCWTTDEQGANGYNNNNGGPINMWACINYPSSGDASGNYVALFNGTSAATPHVAGLAGLLVSQYPALTNQQVRDIIERTCTKVNPAMYPYAHDGAHPNGTWHQEAGYGRINCNAALRYADIMISDHELDSGAVPSSTLVGGTWTPKAFWSYQPYVTTTDQPGALPVDHEPAIAGQDNYVHALVANLGPTDVANVEVTWHMMDYPNTELLWPADWNAGNQIASATIPSISAGTSVPVQALWPEALVDVASAYIHPCMVVQAISSEDIGGDLSDRVYGYNNIAQHNISFAGFSSPATEAARTFTLPFAIGHVLAPARRTRLLFDLTRANGATAILDTDPDPRVPYIDRILEVGRKHPPKGDRAFCGGRIVNDTRIVLDCGGCSAEVVLKAGSTFRVGHTIAAGPPHVDEMTFTNAAPRAREGKLEVLLEEPHATVSLLLRDGQVLPMAVTLVAPASALAGDEFAVDVTQISDGVPTGGVTLEVTAR